MGLLQLKHPNPGRDQGVPGLDGLWVCQAEVKQKLVELTLAALEAGQDSRGGKSLWWAGNESHDERVQPFPAASVGSPLPDHRPQRLAEESGDGGTFPICDPGQSCQSRLVVGQTLATFCGSKLVWHGILHKVDSTL